VYIITYVLTKSNVGVFKDTCQIMDIIISESSSFFLISFPYSWSTLLVYGFMMFNATFNNISVILWRSVLLVKETGVPGEPAVSH
jgi:hypothetical protein